MTRFSQWWCWRISCWILLNLSGFCLIAAVANEHSDLDHWWVICGVSVSWSRVHYSSQNLLLCNWIFEVLLFLSLITHWCWELNTDGFDEGSDRTQIQYNAIKYQSCSFIPPFIDQQQHTTYPHCWCVWLTVWLKLNYFYLANSAQSLTLPPLHHLTQSEPDSFSWHLWLTSCVGRQ